jgi:hypothetical protein
MAGASYAQLAGVPTGDDDLRRLVRRHSGIPIGLSRIVLFFLNVKTREVMLSPATIHSDYRRRVGLQPVGE